jgi:hypothetical protein
MLGWCSQHLNWEVLIFLPLCVHRFESMGRARKTIRAQQLWFAILEAQIETGNPYMLFKDSCNRKSNQQVSCSLVIFKVGLQGLLHGVGAEVS